MKSFAISVLFCVGLSSHGYAQPSAIPTGVATSANQAPLTAPGTPGSSGTTVSSGNVGGFTAAATVAPTVTASSAYTAGYTIGGLMTFTGLVRSTQTSAVLQKAVVSFSDTQTPSIDLFLFNASPTSSTTTDHAAFALASADIGKVVGVIHATDCSAAGTPTVCQAQQQAVPFVLGSAGGSLYVVAVTRGTPTLTSTSDMTVSLAALED